MAMFTVTARGQVSLRKEILRHLGIKPGEKIQVDLLPGGKGEFKAAAKRRPISEIAGCLKGKTNGAVLTLEEIDEAIAEAGAQAAIEGLER